MPAYGQTGNLEEVLLLVGLNGAVGRGVGDAGEREALAHLIVVEEGSIGLVNGASGDDARAGGAGAGTARVGKVDAVLLGLVEDVDVVGALNAGGAVRGDEGHRVHLGGGGAGGDAGLREGRDAGEGVGGADEEGSDGCTQTGEEAGVSGETGGGSGGCSGECRGGRGWVRPSEGGGEQEARVQRDARRVGHASGARHECRGRGQERTEAAVHGCEEECFEKDI